MKEIAFAYTQINQNIRLMNILDSEKRSEKPTKDHYHSSIPIQSLKNVKEKSVPTSDQQADNPDRSKDKKVQRKLKQVAELTPKNQSVASFLTQLLEYPFKSTEVQIEKEPEKHSQKEEQHPKQEKVVEKRHSVLFQFFELPSARSVSQNTRLQVPRTKSIFDKNLRKNSKDSKQDPQIQQSINTISKKLDSNQSKNLIATQAYSTLSTNSQNHQGPRLMLSRYGAHRRLQAQKEQENMNLVVHSYQYQEKLLVDSVSEKSKESMRGVKVQEMGSITISQKQQQIYSFSRCPSSKLENGQLIKTINTESQPNLNTQASKKLTRNSGRIPLKTKKTITSENDKQLKKKKKSCMILHASRKIIHQKVMEIFQKIKNYHRYHKIKIQKFGHLLSIKIRSIFNHIVNKHYAISFAKIKKFNQVAKPPTPMKKTTKTQKIGFILMRNKKMLVLCLNRLFLRKIAVVYKKINGFKKKYLHKDRIIHVLNKLAHRKIHDYFNKFVFTNNVNFGLKCQLMGRLMTITKQYYYRIQHNAFVKLKSFKIPTNAITDKTTKHAPSPPSSPSVLSPLPSPRIVIKLQKQLQNNTEKLSTLMQSTQKQKQQYQIKIERTKQFCEELTQKNEEKKRISVELKQRAEMMVLPEQNYIQEIDIMTDTKFPILYELYIKIQKSGMTNIKIDDLLRSFQFLEQEMKSDLLVKNWVQLLQNSSKKQQVSQYEGQLQKQRKAARMAHEEEVVLIEMIRGYIREKYMWELVKNALSNTSALA